MKRLIGDLDRAKAHLRQATEIDAKFKPIGAGRSRPRAAVGLISHGLKHESGCGIAPNHVDKVFDRFFRGDAARTSEGTGLGLAIVNSIMEIHKGSVSIKSDLDRGTVVTLTFPDLTGANRA